MGFCFLVYFYFWVCSLNDYEVGFILACRLGFGIKVFGVCFLVGGLRIWFWEGSVVFVLVGIIVGFDFVFSFRVIFLIVVGYFFLKYWLV